MTHGICKYSLSKKTPKNGEFDLKQGAGGIVSTEFVLQYGLLAWPYREPQPARRFDNVRIIETLGREGFFEQHESEALAGAYLAYRCAANQLSLRQRPGNVTAAYTDAERRDMRAAGLLTIKQ